MTREEERHEAYRRTVAIFVAAVVLILSFMIVRPFMVAILSAAALAYIFYPLYLRILKYMPKKLPAKNLASIATCLIIILLVLVPSVFIIILLTYEVRSGYLFLREFIPHWTAPGLPPFLSQWAGFLPQFNEIAADLAGQFIDVLQSILKRIPSVGLGIFITIFSIYYFLKHGKDIYQFFSDVLPLPEGRNKQIISRFDDLSRGMIMGQFVVGAIQGILAWFGFLMLGVPNPVLWGFLTALISVIPLLGAAIVWLPVVVYLLLVGMTTGEYWRAITLLIYGTLVISTIDNILKPKIIGERAKIHPLIILFGILGGIQFFGIPGILIGPLVLTLFDVVIEIYRESL